MRSVVRSSLLGLCALPALIAAAIPALANKGSVRGIEMNGYGRLILSLERMPRATVTVTSGVLVLTFAEPVNVDPEKVPDELAPYVSAARRDPDGKGLRFALARPLKPHLKEAGEKIYLDLLPETWRGLPPSLPQDVVDDLGRRAREAEEALRRQERRKQAEEVRTMPVRVGRTQGMTRLVFEMPATAPVSFKKVEDRIDIAFDAAFRIDAVRLRGELGASARSVEADTTNAALRVSLSLPPGVEAQGFREDDSFIVDIVDPATRKTAASPEAAMEAARGPAPSGKPATARVEPAAQPAPAPQAPPPPPKPAEPVEAAKAAPAVPAGPVRPQVTRVGESVRIALKFNRRTPAAAYERAGNVTLVFDTAQAIELGDASPVLKEIGASLDLNAVARARVLRLQLASPRLVRLAPEGDGWVVTIGEILLAAAELVTPVRAIDDAGRTVLTLPLRGVSGVHWIDDPDTGERIAVATALAPLKSVSKPQRFPEFELLSTAHGAAVIAGSDDLAVRAGIDEVVIERGNGLAITPRIQKAGAEGGEAGAQPVVFEAKRWLEDRGGLPRTRIRGLERQAADAPRGRRTHARLALARVLLANGLASEARGVVEAVIADEPAMARERTVAMMRVAATAMMGRLDDARRMANEDHLRGDPEADLWTAIADARLKNWPRAVAGFRAAEALIDAYPEELQAMILRLTARAAVEVRDFGSALGEIERLEKLDRGWRGGQESALLRARIDEGQGRPDEAMAGYQRVFESDDRPAAAEAGLRAAKLGLGDATWKREAVLERLETVSVIWRGDAIEADTLAALGRLYAEEGRWRDAFAAARRANELYPNHEAVRALHDETARLFEGLFLEGKAEAISRVDALALFYDFKDFTPPGRRGDEIVRRLADRLVALDLLDNAAELLQHQIDNRVTGAQRSVIAARLAIIHLMNRKPAQALTAIKTTRLPELAWGTKRARGLLETRALSDLSRTDLALDVIAHEKGADIDRLRADIQWQGRRWRAAGETYELILGERWKRGEALSERERADVIRAAIAYSLAEEALSLDRVRVKYAGPMAMSADARAFALITAPSSSKAREFREVARSIARSDTLSEFLDEYRKRYPEIPQGASPKREAAPPPALGQEPAGPAAAQAAPGGGAPGAG